MYWFTGPDEAHAEETSGFSSQVIAQLNKMSPLNDTIMDILRPLSDAGCASLDLDSAWKRVWNCFQTVIPYCCHISERKAMSS